MSEHKGAITLPACVIVPLPSLPLVLRTSIYPLAMLRIALPFSIMLLSEVTFARRDSFPSLPDMTQLRQILIAAGTLSLLILVLLNVFGYSAKSNLD